MGMLSMLNRFVLRQPSSYSQEFWTTVEDLNGDYLQASSKRTEDTGSSSAVLAMRTKQQGHMPALRLQI